MSALLQPTPVSSEKLDDLDDHSLVVLFQEGDDPDELFSRVCARFPTSKIEQSPSGDVIVLAPAGSESSYKNSEVTFQLQGWAKENRRGFAFDSSVEFVLPDGSKRGPDASWVRREKYLALSREERRGFPKLVPDFVVEIKSPSDKLSRLKSKMLKYMRNGVSLGWLIDADQKLILIYENQYDEPKELRNAATVEGTGLMTGFVLTTQDLWTEPCA